jgi:hypothetical protein
MYNILIEFGVPMKLVRLIIMCLNETGKVRVGKHLSDNFSIQNGLKRDALSPLQVTSLKHYRLCHPCNSCLTFIIW